MKTYMELMIPNAVINPTLEDIQNNFLQVLNSVLDTNKYIAFWGQDMDGKFIMRIKLCRLKHE